MGQHFGQAPPPQAVSQKINSQSLDDTEIAKSGTFCRNTLWIITLWKIHFGSKKLGDGVDLLGDGGDLLREDLT